MEEFDAMDKFHLNETGTIMIEQYITGQTVSLDEYFSDPSVSLEEITQEITYRRDIEKTLAFGYGSNTVNTRMSQSAWNSVLKTLNHFNLKFEDEGEAVVYTICALNKFERAIGGYRVDKSVFMKSQLILERYSALDDYKREMMTSTSLTYHDYIEEIGHLFDYV